jgi:DNA processing protein
MSRPYYRQTEELFLAALSALPGLGPKRLNTLRGLSGSWEEVWRAKTELWQEAGISLKIQAIWQEKKKLFSPPKLQKYLDVSRTFLISQQNPNYPKTFHQLADAPLLLYARGKWQKDIKIISVTGSRQPSSYGLTLTKKLIPLLVQQGYGLASGLALGIDALAHRLSLEHNAYNLAILGSGLDYIYPNANRNLVTAIIQQGGLILSEYPPSARPLAANFIQRNRLIAAIAEKVLVLEAKLDSGSMRTARWAQKLGKELYAAPGKSLTPQTAGCRVLIQEGAQPINNIKNFPIKL